MDNFLIFIKLSLFCLMRRLQQRIARVIPGHRQAMQMNGCPLNFGFETAVLAGETALLSAGHDASAVASIQRAGLRETDEQAKVAGTEPPELNSKLMPMG